ncbi:uroporphyrinogen-III synthase, partial [Actinomyces johnsonii]|uniref:uroporphyrinogen-III synthase n=1 Tax=Actinomyces johnsonii TaxID=544581 RepID=UPI000553BBD3
MAESASGSRPAGRPPGQSHKATGTPLAGRVVLLPRLRERDRIASALERAGSQVLRVAVTRTVPGDTAVLEVTARRIVAGEAAWLVLTSARTVEVLAPYLLAEVGIGPTAGAPGHRDAPDASNADPDAAASPARAASSEQRQLATATSSMRVAVVGPATGRAWTGLTG